MPIPVPEHFAGVFDFFPLELWDNELVNTDKPRIGNGSKPVVWLSEAGNKTTAIFLVEKTIGPGSTCRLEFILIWPGAFGAPLKPGDRLSVGSPTMKYGELEVVKSLGPWTKGKVWE